MSDEPKKRTRAWIWYAVASITILAIAICVFFTWRILHEFYKQFSKD